MTTQQIFENIHDVFPNVLETQILLDMDEAQKQFASDTGVLVGSGQLTSISSNFAWSLPTDFSKLLDVHWYDSNNKPVYEGDSDFEIAHRIRFNKFYVYATDETPIDSVPTAASTGFLEYEQLPTTITSTAVALEIPNHYRQAVLSKVLGKYYGLYNVSLGIDKQGNPVNGLNLNAAGYHEKMYDKIRIKAKKEFRSREKTTGSARFYPYGGDYALPKEMRDTAQGSTTALTTQLLALTALYGKYASYDFTQATGTVTASVTAVGYTTIAASLTGDTLTVTSTGEFEVDTMVLCNNGGATWSRTDANTITLTMPSGWTEGSIEIYERVD